MIAVYAYRPGMLVDKTDNATIAPGPTRSNRDTPLDISDFHVAHVHVHEGAQCKTATQLGVTLERKLRGCNTYKYEQRVLCSQNTMAWRMHVLCAWLCAWLCPSRSVVTKWYVKIDPVRLCSISSIKIVIRRCIP